MNLADKQKELAAYKEMLAGKTLDELKALEQEVIKEADETDKKVQATAYELPKENYKVVAESIRKILDKIAVQWQYTLGLLSIYEFWDPAKREKEVLYPMLDSTLRTLGEQTFKGYEEWAAVVAINRYFEPLREKYVETTEAVYDVATRHNEIMNAMKALAPQLEDELPDEVQVG